MTEALNTAARPECFDFSYKIGFEEFVDSKVMRGLDPRVIEFSKAGVKILEKSKDPAHQTTHLERLFGLSREFLESSEGTESGVDVNILLAAITWHDAWRVQNFSTNLAVMIRNQLTEGKNSGRYTDLFMRKEDMEEGFIDKVAETIRLHPDPLIISRRSTPEARLLHDVDFMDTWNPERHEEINGHLGHERYSRFLRWTAQKRSKNDYYFDFFNRVRDYRVAMLDAR